MMANYEIVELITVMQHLIDRQTDNFVLKVSYYL